MSGAREERRTAVLRREKPGSEGFEPVREGRGQRGFLSGRVEDGREWVGGLVGEGV